MIDEVRIRGLMTNAEDHFHKIGPVYALTELLLKLNELLPAPLIEVTAAPPKVTETSANPVNRPSHL